MDESKYDKIERYLLEEMPSKEEHEFEKELNESEDLRDDTKFMAYVINSVQKAGLEEDNRRLTAMRASMVGDNKRYWMSTAAMIAVVLFIGVYAANRYFMPHGKQGSEQSIEGNEYDPNQTAPEIKPNSPQDLHPADSCKKTNDSIIDNKKTVTTTGGKNEALNKNDRQKAVSTEPVQQSVAQETTTIVTEASDESVSEESVSEDLDFVDLGLSVKWATMNVGAGSVTSFGDYFAWGETSPKPKNREGSCYLYGTYTEDIAGSSSFDAAKQLLGERFRMPTRSEWEELRRECVWEPKTINGVNGYLVTSRTNGNHIFLPAAGKRYNNRTIGFNRELFYWTSTPDSDTKKAYVFNMTSKSISRSEGCTIRPVAEKSRKK